ncbi:MAG: hypothetical protein VB018_03845 [Lachnospiraceae bacterium]|nr:hypothetical protein [Lachnospiraceae bacterium]
MKTDELIKALREKSLYVNNASLSVMDLCIEAADLLEQMKKRIEAKETVIQLIETTMSMLSSDKDSLIHKWNVAENKIAKLKASQPVRCVECLHYVKIKNFDNECGITGGCVRDDDYCSCGKRRVEE